MYLEARFLDRLLRVIPLPRVLVEHRSDGAFSLTALALRR